MSGADKDPNEGLADDAVLATDLGDETERKAEQLSYYGGDDDDIEIGADRGDDAEPKDEEEESDDDAESEEAHEGSEEDEGEDSEEGSDDAESDDEAEDDAADDGDEEDSEDEVDDTEPKDKGIPRHRFNEVNTRMRDAEAELARRDAEKTAGEEAAVEKFDFDKAEEEYMSLLLDGKTKDAAGKRREIREAEKADFKAEAKTETLHDVDSGNMARVVDSLSKEAETMFPAFNADSENFNPNAVSKTLTYMKAYQLEGMKQDDAFVAALADVIELFDLATETPGDEEPEPKKGKKVTKKEPIKKTKEKLALQKKQARTPAGEGDASADRGAATPDINDLTDEEIDALPADTLSRLRGDFM